MENNDQRINSLSQSQFLRLLGEDFGLLFGYPFVVSDLLEDQNLLFSSDWQELWIAEDTVPLEIEFLSGSSLAIRERKVFLKLVYRWDYHIRRRNNFVVGIGDGHPEPKLRRIESSDPVDAERDVATERAEEAQKEAEAANEAIKQGVAAALEEANGQEGDGAPGKVA